MTNVEKVNNLLEKVKSCPDSDIHQYWSPMVQIFLPMPKAERQECADGFYKWAEENASDQSLKLHYAEFLLGANYMLAENYEYALPMVSKARKEFEEMGDNDGFEMCSLIIGVCYRSLGNFDLALKTLMNPFAYFKQTSRYPIFLGGSCNSLGNVHLELHNYEEAFSIFNTGYETGLKIGDIFFPIYALDGMGKAKMEQGNNEEAIKYFSKALEEAEKINSLMHIGNAMNELAVFNFRTGNLSSAEQLNKQALAIREQEKFIGGSVTCYLNLGEIYIRQSRWDEALDVLQKGLALAEQIKVKPKMSQVHLMLSKVYNGLGKIEESYRHFKIYHELREKIQEEDSARKLTDAKLIFEAEQTKKENIIIKKQKQEIEFKNHQLQDTIDELTITKVSRKARGITLIVGIILIIAEEPILHYILRYIGEENLLVSLTAKVVVILSLKPIDKAIEGFMLRRLVLKKRKHVLEQRVANIIEA